MSLNPDISPANIKATLAASERLGGGGARDDEFLMRLHSHSAKMESCQEKEHRERYIVRIMSIEILLVQSK